ncbi:hypothetical protein [Streptomyces ficellus]|uniref:DUF4232 domain-containing protein n=1 Tax=Streptomyces ficellus TaxID=1977088 RepID=A0A6I6FNR7_9ACTN|nr:hypothetical protein [Streptomyces ficellus]QGV79248.1 hypothetical protein EIZ62_14020 [Streptomyces ficellus]
MGSLRNPVGPLPSSIYWRRRAVAASLVALLALLIVWFVSSGDDRGDQGGDRSDGAAPATTITPGPSSPGPAISEQPGGRDESAAGTGDDGGKNGDTSSPGAGGTDGGTGGGTGSGTDAGTGGDGGGTGSVSGQGGTGSGQQVPANSPLPNCAPGTLQLTLRSAKVSYAPGEKPRFELVARNTSATTCKADLGPTTAVLTVKDDEADQVWSSKDCPRGTGTLLLRVPARGSVTHAVEWDRRPSEPRCATPSAPAAGPGTYLVEAAVPGAKVMPASFTLTKD